MLWCPSPLIHLFFFFLEKEAKMHLAGKSIKKLMSTFMLIACMTKSGIIY